MRSRFSAFAMGDVAYLMHTTAPDGPAWSDDPNWSSQLAAYIAQTRFCDLRILEAPAPTDVAGFVTFAATLEQSGQTVVQTERSRFVRVDGRWTYHSGVGPDPSLESRGSELPTG